MLEFKKVSMEHGNLLRKYLIDNDNLCCEFSFGNSILWDADEKLEFAIVEDVLIYRMVHDEIAYCTPDFKGKVQQILRLMESNAKELGKNYKITCLSEEMMKQILEVIPDEYEFTTDRSHSDYIYRVENLAKLSGKKYHKKKNHLNKFLKNNEFVYEEISKNNANECINMKNKWMESRTEKSESLMLESQAIEKGLSDFEKFGFLGGLIRINGEVCAFTLGERLSENTFVTHFEKALDGIDGLYAAINQQFAQNSLSGKFTFVNREEDMGLEGLRQAKMTYNPEIIYNKYIAQKIEAKM